MPVAMGLVQQWLGVFRTQSLPLAALKAAVVLLAPTDSKLKPELLAFSVLAEMAVSSTVLEVGEDTMEAAVVGRFQVVAAAPALLLLRYYYLET